MAVRRRIGLLLAGVLAVNLAPALVLPVLAVPPECSASRPSAAAASAVARVCGSRVEVLAERTPYAQTFAAPDGTMILEQTVEPRWARRPDGSWSDVDTTLRKTSDGRVAPVATVLPMSFSGGGTTPMAWLADGGAELAVSWPGVLPEPVLEGGTARYTEVLPGVDLRVTATALGFTEVLVVKDRAAAGNAALRKISFGLSTKGVTVAGADGGALEARDSSGRAVFTSPAPVMWDSGQGEQAGRSPAADIGRRLAVMPVELSPGRLAITPDLALLTGPDVRYPLHIDPGWSGGLAGNAWTSVWSRGDTANSSFWQNNSALNNAGTKGGAGSGRTRDCDGCSTYLIRSLFRMNTSGVLGKQILSAVFRVEQRWSWTCNPASPAKLWWTGPISPSTTWNNQPTWSNDYATTTSANHRADATAGCAGVGDIEFGVTGLIQHTVSVGAGEVTVGLRAVDENSINHWKRFNAGTPVLAITYNTVPTMPGPLTIDGKPCASGTNRPVVATSTPVMRARVADADGQNLQVWYAYARWDAARNGFVDVGGGHQDNVPSGATSQLVTETLQEGEIYTFRSQSNDYVGGVSPVTHSPGNCEWQVDLTDPAAPTITGDIYGPGCGQGGCGAVGRTGQFTLRSSSDVVAYRWGFSDPPANQAPAVGGTAKIDWTPAVGGPATLFVRAVDRAGRTSGGALQFTVAGPSPAVGRWRLDEPAGATTLADSSGNGHPITLTGGGAGAPGRFPGVRALGLTGTQTADVTGRVLDTSRSFSIVTWARVDGSGTPQVAVSAMGAHHAAVQLFHSPIDNRWWFEISSADGPTGYTWWTLRSDAPAVAGVWTHLAATFDVATGQMSLFVNGVRQQASATGARPWDAGHRIAVGRTISGSPFLGALSDLQWFDRVITPAELAVLVDPIAQAEVGEWHMDEVGPGPAFDSSGMAHDLTFQGNAEIPPSGAGQTGTGLRLNGSGYTHTDGAVVHTDQSFTVSAWVRIGDGNPATPAPDLPLGNRTAVSQDGVWVAGFFLGYRDIGDGTVRWSMAAKYADSDTGSWTATAGPAPLTAADVGRWVHLVGVYDASAGAFKLYVDGVLADSGPRASRWAANGHLKIGGAVWSPAGGPPRLVDQWVGDIDEVRVYVGAVADVARIP